MIRSGDTYVVTRRLPERRMDRLVTDFENDGFCIVQSVLTQAQVETMREVILTQQRTLPHHYRLLGQSRDGGPIGEHGRWQSGKIMHTTEVFDSLPAHPAVLPLIKRLVGENCCLMHGAYAGLRDQPADPAPRFGDVWPLGTTATAPWTDSDGGILWQMWHREQAGLFAPHHPRCITSIQVRWQLDDTGPDTTCISVVPESVVEKQALSWTPMLQPDGTPHPQLAQLTEPFIVDMWRNRARDTMHLARPGVDVCAKAGDAVLVANTSIHAGTVREGSHQRVDLRLDYGLKGQTQVPEAERVGDMTAAESADLAKSWPFQKVPTRIARAWPELIDTLPPPLLMERAKQPIPKTAPGGGGVQSTAVRGVAPAGTCTPPQDMPHTTGASLAEESRHSHTTGPKL